MKKEVKKVEETSSPNNYPLFHEMLSALKLARDKRFDPVSTWESAVIAAIAKAEANISPKAK